MANSRRIVVVGGGVIGLSTAYFCARAGHRVTVLDRQPERRDGCSFGNAGMVVPSHFIPLAAPGMVALGLRWMGNPESPFYIRPRLDRELLSWGWKFWRSSTAAHVRRSAPLLRDLSLASREAFAELAAEPGNDFGFVPRGLLMLCRTEHALAEEARTAGQARELGLPAEVLDPAQAAALDPDVRMRVAGAVYYPRDCHLAPDRFMAALHRQVEALGGTFRWETPVTGWKLAGGGVRAVQTGSGDIEGDEFVLCGGAWSPGVAEELGLELPLQAGKGYSLTLTRPRQLPRLCAIFTEARVAVTPMGSTLRFGGTLEIAGLNEDINPVRVRGIIRSVPGYYPDFQPEDFAGIQPWRGLRPCSPDGLPYVGRPRRYGNLVVATGHAMMGLSLAPITGRVVAALVSGTSPSFDLSLLSPDRFA
ncbi:MAG: NAD(P)/FAD-dependent oxidoreductase [Verrucomicrobiota bacterium]